MELREATIDDAKFLFELRNDPETVKQSQNRSPVKWKDHVDWLLEILSPQKRRHLYVAVEAHDDTAFAVDVGTGRLDLLDDDVMELSITVAPGARGRGVAKRIISALKDQATEMGFPTQIAHVRENNVGSMIAFLKAGFIPTSNRIVMMTLKP